MVSWVLVWVVNKRKRVISLSDLGVGRCAFDSKHLIVVVSDFDKLFGDLFGAGLGDEAIRLTLTVRDKQLILRKLAVDRFIVHSRLIVHRLIVSRLLIGTPAQFW